MGYDLPYREFKAQMNVYLKNRQHGLKLMRKVGGERPDDHAQEHWENLKCSLLLNQNNLRQPKIVSCAHLCTPQVLLVVAERWE